ncbi:unnamed protein product [Effrenium voratum]|uniref:Uncharacterized protein n=1 Tax=Effrenium voratum TaxID=2562239 RepID=A0AA36IUD0_9DINO|nr:unnamed protein product [Effrenium voratum]
MPGWHLFTCWHDPMHCLFLGTCKHLLSSTMGFWSRSGYLVGDDLEQQLRGLSAEQKKACVGAGLRVHLRTFTPAGTGLDTPSEYPELGSRYKAASVKASVWFFTKKASKLARKHDEDWQLKLISVCFWCLQEGLRLLDASDIILCPHDAEEIHRLFVTHLQCWQHIASLCERRKWRLFKIVPKHHYFQEMAQDLKRNLVNPNRAHACWYDESFLGYIKKIATACHSSSMIQSRFWQRYLLLLAMRFEDARRCSR